MRHRLSVFLAEGQNCSLVRRGRLGVGEAEGSDWDQVYAHDCGVIWWGASSLGNSDLLTDGFRYVSALALNTHRYLRRPLRHILIILITNRPADILPQLRVTLIRVLRIWIRQQLIRLPLRRGREL